MKFQRYLQDNATEISQTIAQKLSIWEKEVSTISPNLTSLAHTLVENCQGGKRLRGALTILGYQFSGKKETKDILDVAAGLEIFQTAILAHDDIIDLSPLRRGRPTIYRQLGGDHYGISQTIILGDIGFFLAVKLINETNFSEKNKNLATREFSNMFIDTALGEILDVELPHLGHKRSEEDVLAIHRLKTAHYTIVAPLKIGAILGQAKPELLAQITEFGENLGIAFQIQDDILGVFGDESVLGKSVTSDIEEGKNTLLITKALENTDNKQMDLLNKYYGKGKINESNLEGIREVFKATGSLQYSQDKALELVAKAKQVISTMVISAEHKSLLNEMADFLVSRNR